MSIAVAARRRGCCSAGGGPGCGGGGGGGPGWDGPADSRSRWGRDCGGGGGGGGGGGRRTRLVRPGVLRLAMRLELRRGRLRRHRWRPRRLGALRVLAQRLAGDDRQRQRVVGAPARWGAGLHPGRDAEDAGVQLVVPGEVDLDVADRLPPVLVEVVLDELGQRVRQLALPRDE